ncbi:MAG: hypothetical protein KQJ78_02430 [Deltaproteobacteria bacterium]|nr:hypothetical protein [Deltaproteobacteria bacterium]
MDFRRMAILAIMDVFLLAELTFSIWLAHFDRSEIAWTFVKSFIPLVTVTILATRFAMKRWAPRRPLAEGEKPLRPFSLFGALENLPTPRRD